MRKAYRDSQDHRNRSEHTQAGDVAPATEDDLELRPEESGGHRARGGLPTTRASAADIESLPVSDTNTSSRLGCSTANPSTGTQAFTRLGTIFSTATSPSVAVT